MIARLLVLLPLLAMADADPFVRVDWSARGMASTNIVHDFASQSAAFRLTNGVATYTETNNRAAWRITPAPTGCLVGPQLDFSNGIYTVMQWIRPTNMAVRCTAWNQFNNNGLGTINGTNQLTQTGVLCDVMPGGQIRSGNLRNTQGVNPVDQHYILITTSNQLTTNAWSFVTITSTGPDATNSVYVNGVQWPGAPLRLGVVTNIWPLTNVFSVGRASSALAVSNSYSTNFVGFVTTPIIYSRALSSAEVFRAYLNALGGAK